MIFNSSSQDKLRELGNSGVHEILVRHRAKSCASTKRRRHHNNLKEQIYKYTSTFNCHIMTVFDFLEQPCNKSDGPIKLLTSC